MNQPFHIFYDNDCYEVVLHGHIIARITLYSGGTQARCDKKYDEVPRKVQDQILDAVEKALNDE